MTDLTPSINQLLREKHAATEAAIIPDRYARRAASPEMVNEFLKEAYRIVSALDLLSIDGTFCLLGVATS